MRVGTVVGDVHGVVSEANRFEDVPEAHASPFRATNCADRPLITGCRWYEFAASIAAALEL